MADFERFQREQDAEREREQRRVTGDIDADDAWERQHQRVRRVRNVFGFREEQRGLTPVHGFAAGTWAQVALTVGWFVVVGAMTGALQMPVRALTVGTLAGAAVVGVLLLLGVVGALAWHRLS